MPSRRHAVPFDPEYFARRSADGTDTSPLDAFRHAYATNHWRGGESLSGPGASLDQTAVIRRQLPELCHRLRVRTLVDLPCGDFSWMARVDLDGINYVGGDLLPELVEDNARRYGKPGRQFLVVNLLESTLPLGDLVLCRDCLVHLSFEDISRAIHNLRRSGITWLLTTTFPDEEVNEDIVTGDWRPINLERAPFNWPAPDERIVERCSEGNGRFSDKSLGLWRIAALGT